MRLASERTLGATVLGTNVTSLSQNGSISRVLIDLSSMDDAHSATLRFSLSRRNRLSGMMAG